MFMLTWLSLVYDIAMSIITSIIVMITCLVRMKSKLCKPTDLSINR